MKKFFCIMTMSLLMACASYYGLSEEEYQKRKNQYNKISQYTNCISFEKFISKVDKKYDSGLIDYICRLHGGGKGYPLSDQECEEKYSSTYSFEVILEAVQNLRQKCIESDGYYFDQSLNNFIREKEDKKLFSRMEKEEQEKESNKLKKMKAAEKKYGKKFCNDPRLEMYTLKRLPIPTNCMTYNDTALFTAQQHTKNGLLVSVIYPNVYRSVFIVKNKKDSSLISGQPIPPGIFIGNGNYTYTTVLGATRTVSKLKRLE